MLVANGYTRPFTAYTEEEFADEYADEFETTKPPPSNRTGSAYIKWVQQSLNKILGLNLATDGAMGAMTRSAIRSFQQKNGLLVDGNIGSKTEAAIQSALGRGNYAPTTSPTSSICSGLSDPVVLDQFDFAKSNLKSAHAALIDQIARCVVAKYKTSSPIQSIQLVGHTDPVGSAARNRALGQQRAEQVRGALVTAINSAQTGLASKITFVVASKGETEPVAGSASKSRRVQIFLIQAKAAPLAPLTASEQAEFDKLDSTLRTQFLKLRGIIAVYGGVPRREADRGSRALLARGAYRSVTGLLTELLKLTAASPIPSGWNKQLLVGNVLFNLAFPETINQGGRDRLGNKGDPTCFSASTQILLARRFPATYVRLVIQLATTQRATFAGGASVGPLTFISTSLFKSLDGVLLQTAFDTYFKQIIASNASGYAPGDEMRVHRQVFGATRAPSKTTASSRSSMVAAFRKAFVTNGGNTRLWEIANLCTQKVVIKNGVIECGNHTVVVTRVINSRVYFYNPWPNELERNTMFDTGTVTVSGNGERPAESSMTQSDFENQLTAVFHN